MTSSLMGAGGSECSSRERFKESEQLILPLQAPDAEPFCPLRMLLSAVDASAPDCLRSLSSADAPRSVEVFMLPSCSRDVLLWFKSDIPA